MCIPRNIFDGEGEEELNISITIPRAPAVIATRFVSGLPTFELKIFTLIADFAYQYQNLRYACSFYEHIAREFAALPFINQILEFIDDREYTRFARLKLTCTQLYLHVLHIVVGNKHGVIPASSFSRLIFSHLQGVGFTYNVVGEGLYTVDIPHKFEDGLAASFPVKILEWVADRPQYIRQLLGVDAPRYGNFTLPSDLNIDPGFTTHDLQWCLNTPSNDNM